MKKNNKRTYRLRSDDRGFLNVLEAQGIPYLTPAAALVLLAERAVVSLKEAQKALERLRPLIRKEQFEAARRDLEAMQERSKL